MSSFEAATRWYAVLVCLTWALAPAVRWLCANLPDRGVTIARPVAVLATVYPAWLIASLGLTDFGAAPVVLTTLLAGLAGWIAILRRGGESRSWLGGLVLTEVASAFFFAAYLWLRGFSPQILGTEKPMNIAFLASSIRTTSMPPPDPWFAGEPINYYYLGYVLHGAVARIAGVVPETGFNLALATIFSTTMVAAFGVVWNLVRSWSGRMTAAASAAFAAFLVVLAGNHYAPWRLLQNAPATVAASWWDGETGIGWRSSRIVCDGPRVGNLCSTPATETINEFPFFSLLLGDLHPHIMGLPYSLVAIALAWNLWIRVPEAELFGPTRQWLRLVFSGAMVGALYPMNAWDFPTYFLLIAVTAWFGGGATIRAAWKPVAIISVSAVLAWLPFLVTYTPPLTAGHGLPIAQIPGLARLFSVVAFTSHERTSLPEYLTVFGVPYLFGIAFLFAGRRVDGEDPLRQNVRAMAVASVALIVSGVILSAPVVPLCGIPLVVAVYQLRAAPFIAARTFPLLLFVFAWSLSIGVEIFYIRDVFNDRMNTLFKFYYQAWTLYAVATGVTLAYLWQNTRSSLSRALVSIAAFVTVVAGSVYPSVASYQWTDGFATWQGLDGLEYGNAESPDEVAAIRWLARHAAPGDIVLEAAGCSYYPFERLPFNRVSAFTGVPTVIGWANHERQWRAGQPDRLGEINLRQADVARIYADPTSALVDTYAVTWLYVGEYEAGSWQDECGTAGPYVGLDAAPFPGVGWEQAFESGSTRLYRRLPP